MREKELEAKVVRYAKLKKVYCSKFTAPGRRGVPDRLFISNGRALFLELKVPGNTPTPLQHHEMAKLSAAGALVAWVDTFDEAKRTIDQFTALSAQEFPD